MARNAYTLDGVPLVHPQLKYYPVQGTGVRVLPAKSTPNIAYPMFDGESFLPGGSFSPGAVKITMFVKGVDHEELMLNIEFLYGLFMQRHKLLELRHDYRTDGTNSRHAFVQFKTSTEPKLGNRNTQATMEFIGEIPGVFWQSLNSVDVQSPTTTTTATQIELSGLSGGNAPITDALIRMKGGFSSFLVIDGTTRHSIQLNSPISSTEYAIIDTTDWSVRKVTSDTWTGGTRIDASAVASRGAGPMLTFEPQIAGGALKYYLTHQVTNPVGSPSVIVRARKKFL